MYPHLLRVSLEPKLSPPVFEVPHQLFLLGIHRDDRLTQPQEASDLAVDMLKLSVPIRMRRAFQSLGVCLQAIAQLVQQLGHQTVADAVTTTAQAQFLGQFAHALASPAQRRLRVTTAQRLDQLLQIPHQRRVLFRRALASSAGFADSSAGRHRGLSSSTMPRAIARLDTPVARETMEIPP